MVSSNIEQIVTETGHVTLKFHEINKFTCNTQFCRIILSQKSLTTTSCPLNCHYTNGGQVKTYSDHHALVTQLMLHIQLSGNVPYMVHPINHLLSYKTICRVAPLDYHHYVLMVIWIYYTTTWRFRVVFRTRRLFSSKRRTRELD